MAAKRKLYATADTTLENLQDSESESSYHPSSSDESEEEPVAVLPVSTPVASTCKNASSVLQSVQTETANVPTDSSRKKKTTRKRIRKESSWKVNKKKALRYSGQEYTDRNGKVHKARCVKTKNDCSAKCKFRCALLISADDRQQIHKHFWSSSREQQQHFFARTTQKSTKDTTIRKRITYSLTVDSTTYRVCKEFYLTTLDVSQQRINVYHKNKDETNTPQPYRTGNNNKKTSEELLDQVRAHIKSYPKIESHYCRADSTAEYLEPHLSISRMYNQYVERCISESHKPVHQKIYTDIFYTEFNLRFHKPKKDRCDRCELYESMVKRVGAENIADEEGQKHAKHMKGRLDTREERHKDTALMDKECLVLSFDLENVLSLPKAEVSSFVYRRKLNVYNLTGVAQTTKKAYCSVWPETLSGRSGNDIASALIAILKAALVDHPEATKLILWSDSCVPQNRNSTMAAALQHFLEQRPQLVSITQKFCEPGHSSIQDVDSLHSQIERHLKPYEIYSPLTLVRHLKNVRKDMNINILKKEDFLDYQTVAKQGTYTGVKFASAKLIKYSRDMLTQVCFTTGFQEPMIPVRVIRNSATRSGSQIHILANPKVQSGLRKLSAEKVADLRAMLPFMPEVDQVYIRTLL